MSIRVAEGLRVLPAYLDARREDPPSGPPWAYESCAACKVQMPAALRREAGCGFEPPAAKTPRLWTPEGMRIRGVKLTTCAAYSSALPEVAETVDAYRPWKERTLTEYLDGEAPTRELIARLVVFEAGINEHEADKIRARSKGGG